MTSAMRRPSLDGNAMAVAQSQESGEHHSGAAMLASGETNLNMKQLNMRTKIEMWLMDEVPSLFGVDDSDELDEHFQEDSQAELVQHLVDAPNDDVMKRDIHKWFRDKISSSKIGSVEGQLIKKIHELRDLGR